MRNYEGMRLPPSLDPHVRNELLKVDKFLKQLPAALRKSLEQGNNPRAIISGGGSTGGGGSGGSGTLPDHRHSETGQGGSILGSPFSLITIFGKVVFAGDTPNQITIGDSSVTTAIVQFYESPSTGGPLHAVISWGANFNALSAPGTTADAVGVAGARLYTYKDPTGQFDSAYGQDVASAWVLVCDETITYDIWTGGQAGVITPFLRASWAGNGDLTNYGRLTLRKNLGAAVKSAPQLRLEETGAGTDQIRIQAPAAVGTTHTLTLPGALPASTAILRVTSAGVITYDTTIDNTNIANRTRRVWIPAAELIQANGTAMSATVLGTYPDVYMGLQFVDAPAAGPQGAFTQWRVPKDWASGTVDVKMVYRLISVGVGADTQFEMRTHALAYTPPASPVAAATTTTTVVTHPANYTNAYEQSLGTITVAADQVVRLVVDRNTGGSDDTTDTVNLIGIALEYTADM